MVFLNQEMIFRTVYPHTELLYNQLHLHTQTIPTASLGNTGWHFPCVVTVPYSKFSLVQQTEIILHIQMFHGFTTLNCIFGSQNLSVDLVPDIFHAYLDDDLEYSPNFGGVKNDIKITVPFFNLTLSLGLWLFAIHYFKLQYFKEICWNLTHLMQNVDHCEQFYIFSVLIQYAITF